MQHTPRLTGTLAALALLHLVPAQRAEAQTKPLSLAGTVYDTVSGAVVALAVVRVAGSAVSTLTNDRGQYRLELTPGASQIDVRRIGYRPTSVALPPGELPLRLNIFLHPLPVELAPLVTTGVDDQASRIIRAAIARKHAVLATIHDYSYQGYVKFVVWDQDKPPDSASSIVLISETRTSAYWEQPNRYQETLLARRQSRNLDAEQNLVSVGEILNLNRERIELRRYSLVSPIADDALDHYAYQILDTLELGGARVFRLAIQPRSETSPLFVGMIDIADSSYDVRGLDVGVNRAVRFSFLRNLRYRQRLEDQGNGRWMPSEIRLSGEVRLGLRLPGFPPHLAFEHAAALSEFRFDTGRRPAYLTEVRLLVAPGADRRDSVGWAMPRAIALSAAERAAWARIDSLQALPRTFGQRVLHGVEAGVQLIGNPDFFRFNRVDGAYVGAGATWRQIPAVVLRTTLGYGTGAERWQYSFGAQFRLRESQRLWIGASYHDETVSRPSFASRSYDPTFSALLFRRDPRDYYRERGATISLTTKLFDFTSLELAYHDQRQSSLPVTTDYSVFATGRPQRSNPLILPGTMRSLSARATYDSRSLLRQGDQDLYLPAPTWTRITLAAELAAPALIPNDFNFRRVTLQVERRQRTFGWGLTTLGATLGLATGTVPGQRYFTLNREKGVLTYLGGGFDTVGDSSFVGNRAAMLTAQHEFGRLLFTKSQLPLIRSLPFTLSIHGGVFVTDFVHHAANPGDSLLRTASRPYSEVGFGLGNLTPFLAPFNLALHLTWQLSSYPTRRFRFELSFRQR